MADVPLYMDPIDLLKERYQCPYFRILVIGRANAGKTTILEKVCDVAQGTKPIVYDQNGVEIKNKRKIFDSVKHLFNKKSDKSGIHLVPTMERGIHEIEHQITYPGSNFIFHDSQGFESGADEEMDIVQEFIAKRSIGIDLKDQLHAIWYCIPMDDNRPLLSTEMVFFTEGTKEVPLVAVFTKFDAQVTQEYVKLNGVDTNRDQWEEARVMAEDTFQSAYLPKVMDAEYPPKAWVKLEDMNMPEKKCQELTEKTADAITDSTLHQLFISTQKNNLDLCVKSALQEALSKDSLPYDTVILVAISKFPHFWANREGVSGSLVLLD